MKVLILPSWYFDKGSSQLSGRMFHHLAAALRKNGVDARIFYGHLHALGPVKKRVTYTVEENVPTWRMESWFPPKMNAGLARAWATKYMHAVKEIITPEWQPDLIHAHSYFTGTVAAQIERATGIPYVFTERMSQFVSGNIPRRYRSLIQSSFDHARAVTTVSDGLRTRLREFTTKDITVIPNFYDPEIFYYDPEVKKNPVFQWITVGEPAGIKGLDILLKAFGDLRRRKPSHPMQLILIDEIKEKKELIRIVDDYQMKADVIWKGVLAQPEMAHIMRQSHVFVSASRIETFGKAIIEAQACGLPVVATITDGAKDIFTDNISSLVEINDADALASAMENVIKVNSDISGTEIAIKAYNRYSEPVVARRWIELYNAVIR